MGTCALRSRVCEPCVTAHEQQIDLVLQKHPLLAQQEECIDFSPFLLQVNVKNIEPKRSIINLTTDKNSGTWSFKIP